MLLAKTVFWYQMFKRTNPFVDCCHFCYVREELTLARFSCIWNLSKRRNNERILYQQRLSAPRQLQLQRNHNDSDRGVVETSSCLHAMWIEPQLSSSGARFYVEQKKKPFAQKHNLISGKGNSRVPRSRGIARTRSPRPRILRRELPRERCLTCSRLPTLLADHSRLQQ